MKLNLLRLPTMGYTVDSLLRYAPVAHPGLHICLSLWTCAIARVFASAQLIRRISRPAPPSELPCGSLSRPSPKVSIHPSGCLRQSFSLRSIMSPYGLPSAGSVGSHSSQNVSPFGLLMQPTAQPPCCLVPSQRPLACVPVCGQIPAPKNWPNG